MANASFTVSVQISVLLHVCLFSLYEYVYVYVYVLMCVCVYMCVCVCIFFGCV